MGAHLSGGLDAYYNEYPTIDLMIDLGIIPKQPNGLLVGSIDDPVLDIGCGRHGIFVEHLRGSGLIAEGLDPELAVEAPYLMKQTPVKIPRSDGYYGTAISHMSLYQGGMIFAGLGYPFEKDGSRLKGYEEFYHRSVKSELMETLAEVRRVVRPGGRFIINPLPALWFKDVKDELAGNGYGIAVESIPSHLKRLPPGYEEAGFEYVHRLILTMPK